MLMADSVQADHFGPSQTGAQKQMDCRPVSARPGVLVRCWWPAVALVATAFEPVERSSRSSTFLTVRTCASDSARGVGAGSGNGSTPLVGSPCGSVWAGRAWRSR